MASDPQVLARVRQQSWWREEYEARDSIRHLPDGRREVVTGGWDHEHCQLCMDVISALDPERRWGYRNEDDEWLCEACYCVNVAPSPD